MDFKLETPIFIEKSFVIPLFDFEFEKELRIEQYKVIEKETLP